MATAAPAIASRPAGSVPYVGLRPFERQERDRFFGRERDAQILCDRILSGRLTILYALSGLGKSSLLRALVIPKLEENDSSVIYFDSWSQPDPLPALKESLIKFGSKLGIPDDGCRSLSLVELARVIASAHDCGLVLVFDQFEEFLVRHAQNLDPFRAELAALIRAPKLDVAVVLTLREEYLAALEPFRQHLLNLFQSAYRLEDLSKEDLARAIREPARLFGGDCESALTDQLIKDLKGNEAEMTAGPQLSLGLPMLQLVCQELWKNAPDGRLTLALYQRLGQTQFIIEQYVEGLMPRGSAAQSFTARLLIYLAPPSGLKMSYSVEDLAGITELPAQAIENELKRLADARILRTREYGAGLRYELEHDAFIPVLRKWRTEVLERDRRKQERKRWMRRVRTVAAVMLLILAAFGYIAYSRHQEVLRRQQATAERQLRKKEKELEQQQMENLRAQRELAEVTAAQAEAAREQLERWQSGGLLEAKELKGLGEAKNAFITSRFDVLTSYLLLKRNDEQRFAELRNVLQKYKDLIPDDYVEPVTEQIRSDADSPLEVVYSKARKMDPRHFMILWRNYGKEMALRGVPVPMELHFDEKENVNAQVMSFSTPGPGSAEFDVPINNDAYLVRYSLEKLDTSPAKEFLQGYSSDWKPFVTAGWGSQWRLVPKWSLPAWKLAKAMTNNSGVTAYEIATSPSGITAYLSLSRLLELDNRKIFFSPRAAEFLIRNLPDSYRTTLEEAIAARGTCLASDVAGRMQEAHNGLALPQVLDRLANQPADPSCFASEGQNSSGNVTAKQPAGKGSIGGTVTKASAPDTDASANPRLHGPWPQRRGFDSGTKKEDKAFSELEGYLLSYHAVRLYVGEALVNTWIPGNQPSQPLKDKLAALHDELYLRYGVLIPNTEFGDASLQGDRPDPYMIRIEIQADPSSERGQALLKNVNGDRAMRSTDPEELVAALRSSYSQARPFWITPETIQDLLNRLPNSTQAWIQSKYSITDLKRLMRMVVSSRQPGEGDSARYATWLMSSLVFWVTEENNAAPARSMLIAQQGPEDSKTLDGNTMRDHLRHLQAVRLNPQLAPDVSPEVSGSVERGIEALVNDNPDEAAAEFANALARDRNHAEQAFCAGWQKQLPNIWLNSYRGEFASLRDLNVKDYVRLDLRDLPERHLSDAPSATSRELTVYRLAAGLIGKGQALPMVRNLLSNYGSANGWPEEPARWLAVRFLQQYDPMDERTGNQRQFDAAKDLLKSAIIRLDQTAAFNAFSDVEKLSWATPNQQYRPTPNWCWKLLADLAEARPHGGSVPLNLELELAWILANEERADRLIKASSLLRDYEAVLLSSALTDDERRQQNEFADYTRAKIERGLQMQGENQRFNEAVRLYRKLLNATRDEIKRSAYQELARMLYEWDKSSEAQILLEQAAKTWPHESGFPAEDMFAQMRLGDKAGVLRVARLEKSKADEQKRLEKPDEENAALFYAALGSMIAQSQDWQDVVTRFINHPVRHQYRDYVLMIFNASSPAASHFLDERWKELDPASWNNRLMNGDTSAWREILIGHFRDVPQYSDLLDILENEDRWKASPFAQLPMSLRGQRCEAWFYEAMGAKARGQRDRMRYALKKCADVGFLAYEEHSMASFLLKQVENTQQSAALASNRR